MELNLNEVEILGNEYIKKVVNLCNNFGKQYLVTLN